MSLETKIAQEELHLKCETKFESFNFHISMVEIIDKIKTLSIEHNIPPSACMALINDRSFTISLNILNYKIDLMAMLNILPRPYIAIQLLEDEIIDTDEHYFPIVENLADLESTDDQLLEDLTMTIGDAFLEELFLEDGWRMLNTIIFTRFDKKETAEICESIFSSVCENTNKWLNSLLNK